METALAVAVDASAAQRVDQPLEFFLGDLLRDGNFPDFQLRLIQHLHAGQDQLADGRNFAVMLRDAGF